MYKNRTVLAEEMQTHGYFNAPQDKLKSWVTPLFPTRQADGPVIRSEMSVEEALIDQIALRLWANRLAVQ